LYAISNHEQIARTVILCSRRFGLTRAVSSRRKL